VQQAEIRLQLSPISASMAQDDHLAGVSGEDSTDSIDAVASGEAKKGGESADTVQHAPVHVPLVCLPLESIREGTCEISDSNAMSAMSTRVDSEPLGRM
jgi:hypothetical protein